jgi:Short C-terminal domain
MTMTEADIFCPTCQAYVHVFLERCPACGAARSSLAPAVRAEAAVGLVKLADDAVLRRKLTHLLDGYALTAPRLDLPHKTGFEGKAGPDLTIAEGTGMLIRLLVLRGYGVPPRPSEPAEVRLALSDEDLEVQGAGDRHVAVRIALAGILSVVAPSRGGLSGWAGIHSGGAAVLRTLPIPPGSLLITYVADRAVGQISVQNRPGMFSSKARADYYGNVRRWLGLTAAEAAERRWTAIGLPGYLAEIGLGPSPAAGGGALAGGVEAAAATAAPASGVDPAVTRSSTRAALEELEELRSAGLVTDDEYRRKRAEILARL